MDGTSSLRFTAAPHQTLFDHATVVPGSFFTDTNALALGLVFYVDIPGEITQISFYKHASDTATSRDVRIYDLNQNVVASGTSSSEPLGAGWISVTLSSPLAVNALTAYVAVVHFPIAAYAAQSFAFNSQSIIRGNVYGADSADTSLGNTYGNGRYDYSATILYPTSSYQGTNYYIDISLGDPQNDSVLSGTASLSGNSNLGLGASGTISQIVYVSSKSPGVNQSWTQQTGSGSRTWYDVAGSSDGTKLVAIVFGGYIYTSTDSGVTWTQQTGSGSRNWYSVASSADGTKLVALHTGGYIYTSTDSGVTWTQQTSSGARNWVSVASSTDGTKLVAVISNSSYIFTSTDSGVTWTAQTGSGLRAWTHVASSADGTKLAATAGPSHYIYTSTDSGVTWTQRTSSGLRNWQGIASSADGTNLVAVVYNGYIYTSTDSGVTWIQRTSAGLRNWYRTIVSSASGSSILAWVDGSYIYTSTDYGVTWTQQISLGTGNWYGHNISSDGSKIVTAKYNGYIHTTNLESETLVFSLTSEIVAEGNLSGTSTLTFDASLIVYPIWGEALITFDSTGTAIPIASASSKIRSLTSASVITSPSTSAYFTNLCSSLDGTKLVASNSDTIWTSSDSGASWTLNYTSSWTITDLVCSADGTKIVVVNDQGVIVSNDSGTTWSALIVLPYNSSGYRAAISDDGTKIAACGLSNGYIHTSTDSGATWTQRTNVGQRHWSSIASSADGTKLIAVSSGNGGYVYTSTDSGVTWTEQTSSGFRVWTSVSMSSDGSYIIAGAANDYVTTSTDFGSTWINDLDLDVANVQFVRVSPDGNRVLISENISGYKIHYKESGQWTRWSSDIGLLNDAVFANQEILIARNAISNLYKAAFTTPNPQTVLSFRPTATLQSSSITNKPINNLLIKGFYAPQNAKSLYISDDMHMQVYWYGKEIFFTYDMGKTWTPVSLNVIPNTVVLYEFNSQIYINVVYVENSLYYGRVYKLSVDGLSWELITQLPGSDYLNTSISLSSTKIYTIDTTNDILSIYDLSDGSLIEQFNNFVDINGDVFETPKSHVLVILWGAIAKTWSFNTITGTASLIGSYWGSGSSSNRLYSVSKSGQYVVRKEPSVIKLSTDYGLTYSTVVNAQSLYTYAASTSSTGKIDVDDLGNIYVTSTNGTVHRFVMNGLTPTAREAYILGGLYSVDAILSPNKKSFVYRTGSSYGALNVSKLSQDGTSLVSSQATLSAQEGYTSVGFATAGVIEGLGSIEALAIENYAEFLPLVLNDLYTIKAPYGPDVFTFSDFTVSQALTTFYHAYDDSIYVIGGNNSYLQKYESNGTFLEAYKLDKGISSLYSKLQFVSTDIIYSQNYDSNHIGVYVSSNGSPFFPKTDIGNLYEYTVASAAPAIRYALTKYTSGRDSVLLKSIDSGVTWSTQYAPGDFVNGMHLAVSNDGTVVIIASSIGIRISINSGVDWVSVAGNYKFVSISPDAQSVIVVNSTNSMYYANVATLYGGGSLTSIASVTNNFANYESNSNWLTNTEFLYLDSSSFVAKYTVGGSSTSFISESTLSVTVGNNSVITVKSADFTVRIWNTSASLLNSFLPTDGLKYISAYDYDISNGYIDISQNNRLFVTTNDYLSEQSVTTVGVNDFYYDDLYDAQPDRYTFFFVIDFSFNSGNYFDAYVGYYGGSNGWYELYSYSGADNELVTGNQRFTNLRWEIYDGINASIDVDIRISEDNPIIIGSFGVDESDRVFFRINGELIAQTEPLVRDGTAIGYAYPDTNYPMLEGMFIQNPLDTDIEILEGHLAHKWNRETALDVSHTYKTAPPVGPGTGYAAHASFESLADGAALAFIEATVSVLTFVSESSIDVLISGSSFISFSGELIPGNYSIGSSETNFIASATLNGSATVEAVSSLEFFNSSVLSGLIEANANTQFTFILNAGLLGTGDVVTIAASLEFQTSTSLIASGYLEGTSSIEISNDSSITGYMYATASSEISYVISGTQTGSGLMIGSSTLWTTIASFISATVPIYGTTSGISLSASGFLQGYVDIVGSTTLAIDTGITLLHGISSLIGTSSLSLQQTGNVTGLGSISNTSTVLMLNASPSVINGLGTVIGSTATTFTMSVPLLLLNVNLVAVSDLVIVSNAVLKGTITGSGISSIAFILTATGDALDSNDILKNIKITLTSSSPFTITKISNEAPIVTTRPSVTTAPIFIVNKLL